MVAPTAEDLAGHISVTTALTIQGNDVDLAVGGEGENYGFEIYRFEREIYRPLVTCKPVFDSKEGAREVGQGVIDRVRSWDLTDKIPKPFRDDYVPPDGSVKP